MTQTRRYRWLALAALALALVLLAVELGGGQAATGAADPLAQAAALAPAPAPDLPTLAFGPRFPNTVPESVLPLPTEPPPECAADADCDDGVWCTGEEACQAGRCLTSAAPCADDGEWCNGREACDELARACRAERVPRCAAEGRVCDEVSDGCALSLDFVAWVTAQIETLPDLDEERYVPPARDELLDFADAVRALFTGDRARAAESAAMIGYEVVPVLDTELGDELLWALLPVPENRDGRGLYVIRPSSTTIRELLVEAPHPRYDLGSGAMAARLFRDTGGRAFAMAGTHRCAPGPPSSCGGIAAACADGHAGERPSGVGDRTFFQVFHEVARELRPESTLVLQVHAFASHEGAPAYFISDGTEHDSLGEESLPGRLARAIEQRSKARGKAQRVARADRGDGSDQTWRVTAPPVGDNACVRGRRAPDRQVVHLELCYDLVPDGDELDPAVVVEATTAVIPEVEWATRAPR